jgi:GNAT superfamily N-acetyltransferase
MRAAIGPEQVARDEALAARRIEAMYRASGDGRIETTNEWDGRPAPRIHLFRSAGFVRILIRHDIADYIALRLLDLAEYEPQPAHPRAAPRFADAYLRILAEVGPVQAVWSGPALRFPERVMAVPPDVVPIGLTNAGLLLPLFPDWLADVPHRQPFVAAVSEGRAVAVCASVRITPYVHEAGVATAPQYRRRGHAMRAVAAWAGAVRDRGAEPVYSTAWENAASLAVARSLGLDGFGSDYRVT